MVPPPSVYKSSCPLVTSGGGGVSLWTDLFHPPPLVVDIWNEANFPFHQPGLFIGFRAASSQTPHPPFGNTLWECYLQETNKPFTTSSFWSIQDQSQMPPEWMLSWFLRVDHGEHTKDPVGYRKSRAILLWWGRWGFKEKAGFGTGFGLAWKWPKNQIRMKESNVPTWARMWREELGVQIICVPAP